MLNKFICSILLSCSVIALPAYAEIYQSRDADGNIVFTDQPSSDAKPVELKQTNTTKAIKTTPRPKQIKPQQADAIYSNLSITSPRNGHHIVNGLVAFNVNMSVQPALIEGHVIELSLNGSTQSKGRSLSRQISSIERGEHTLSAKVIDATGKTLISSQPVKISAQRPSIIKPR